MSWWKLTVSHGPGHQSQTTKFFWFEEACPAQRERDQKADALMHKECFYSAIARWSRVKKLPKATVEAKLVIFQRQMEHAKKMIKLLENG